ncbi:MAG: peptidase [Firmicutes bacterium]|nr:peptidase [Bacillota bacterium]
MSEKEGAAAALEKMLAAYEEKAAGREELRDWVSGLGRDLKKAMSTLKKGA